MTDDVSETTVRAIMACTLPKTAWTHTAHFAAALWLLRHLGEVGARADMPGLIRG
ncbi:MAG: hypothetical protein WEA77_10630 [Hyphomonas sp.]|uniref:hypothetical protein n=1 Tax=Hyphomonas sp. TaxID=87 RepID=UPI0034A09C48